MFVESNSLKTNFNKIRVYVYNTMNPVIERKNISELLGIRNNQNKNHKPMR